jgi:hypothetical protein
VREDDACKAQKIQPGERGLGISPIVEELVRSGTILIGIEGMPADQILGAPFGGGAIGSVFPCAGTVIGSGVGGVAGAIGEGVAGPWIGTDLYNAATRPSPQPPVDKPGEN